MLIGCYACMTRNGRPDTACLPLPCRRNVTQQLPQPKCEPVRDPISYQLRYDFYLSASPAIGLHLLYHSAIKRYLTTSKTSITPGGCARVHSPCVKIALPCALHLTHLPRQICCASSVAMFNERIHYHVVTGATSLSRVNNCHAS